MHGSLSLKMSESRDISMAMMSGTPLITLLVLTLLDATQFVTCMERLSILQCTKDSNVTKYEGVDNVTSPA